MKVEVPPKYSARILSLINNLDLKSDTVGTGEIYVDLQNRSGSDYNILKGSPLAYLVIEERKILEPIFQEGEKATGKIFF